MAKKSKKSQKKAAKKFKKWQKSSQKYLNMLDNTNRVIELTSLEKIEVCERIFKHHESGNDKDGESLYLEYAELIDDRFEDHVDREESFWVHAEYLSELLNERRFGFNRGTEN